MKEIWKPINHPAYSDVFMVSNFGNVKRIKKFNKWSSKGKECDFPLNQFKNHKGYLCVWLYQNGVRKCNFVHRLVAMTFLENPKNLPQVNHIDGNKENNHITNLEWCSAKQNVKHAIENGLFMANRATRPVYQFSLDGNFLKKWDSGMEASRFYNIGEDCIYECCNNNRHSSHGYCWSYSKNFSPKKLKIQQHHRNGVIQYDSQMNEISRFQSIKEAESQTGTNRSRISLCCSHKIPHANGYLWEYA